MDLLEKIEKSTVPLGNVSSVSTGLKAYQIGKGKPKQSKKEKEGRTFHSKNQVDNSYSPYLEGVDVRRYKLVWSGQFIKYGDWLAEPRKSVPFQGSRILVRQIPSKPPLLINGVYVEDLYYNDINSMMIFTPTKGYSLLYLLGVINSRLISFWFSQKFDKLQRKIFPQFKVKELASFPIQPIDFANVDDRKNHDSIVLWVQKIQKLKLIDCKTPQEHEQLQREIDSTDRQIDALVYQLYNLTDDEIKLVENST